MGRESCKDCEYCTSTHWTKQYDYMCTMSGEAFLVNPSSIPPCLNYRPKPEYSPKENKVSPSYTELREELERLQEAGDKISRELEVWMNSVDEVIGLLRHKEEEINKLRRIKAEITGEKECD